MRVSIIVALANNLAIGKNNDLLYHLPNDMKRFRQLTTGNTVIMGRRTFESLPKGALPNRRNIVLSSSVNKEQFPGADLFPSLPDALAYCEKCEQQGDERSHEVFIIGGASVYRTAVPYTQRLCVTWIDDTPADADTYFPNIELDEWVETLREEHPADERHAFPYEFVNYERIN